MMIIRRIARTLYAPLWLVAGACASGGVVSAEPAQHSAFCSKQPGPLASVAASIEVAVQGVKLVQVTDLKGECAQLIERATMGQVRFSDGRTFRFEPDGRLDVGTGGFVQPSAVKAEQAPRLPGARFVSAARRSATAAGLEGDFVGLWRTAKGWTVASFTIDGGDATPAVALLRSSLPLRGVAYAPAVDSPTGRLSVVQESAGKVTRIVDYDWHHG